MSADPLTPLLLKQAVAANVKYALAEDVGSGDVTARLIAETEIAEAIIITREKSVICGVDWVEEVFRQLDKSIEIIWSAKDGDYLNADAEICRLRGPARSLLTGERCALNFLQTLSGTATKAREYADKIAHTQATVLDTRKTLPGLRFAQKYAVACGGCQNHRLGLWDAFLIKENHIAACGSISSAVESARKTAPGKPVEVEVESIEQLKQALRAGAAIIMLDNFSIEATRDAVLECNGRAKLEASGGLEQDTLTAVAETGVDYISIGALTKHCRAVDLSMRLI